MTLSRVLTAVFLVLLSISQHLLDWVQFGRTGLVVTGVIGLAAGVLTILEDTERFSYRIGNR
jgi:F0F1-type ATP synthase assembly protein I